MKGDTGLIRDMLAFMKQIRTTNRVPEDWWAPSGRAWIEVEEAAEKALAGDAKEVGDG